MKPRLQQKQLWRTPTGGFTLIELLVVISIIAVIASIGVVVGTQMQRSGLENQTRLLLGQLMGAATEYREQTGRHVTFDVDMETYDDADPFANDARSINTFVSNVRLNARPAFEQLRTVDEQSIDGDGGITDTAAFNTGVTASDNNTVRDSFDQIVRYYPGSSNATNTVNDANLIDKGMPKRKQPYFASAGQDGLWGAINSENNFGGTVDSNMDSQPDSQDNIYSFEVQ